MDEQTKEALRNLVKKVEQANKVVEAYPNEGGVIEKALNAGKVLAQKVKEVVGTRPTNKKPQRPGGQAASPP